MSVSSLTLFYIVFCSLIVIRAFQEWLMYEHPIMERAIWFLIFPAYLVILITSVVTLFVTTPHLFLLLLRDIGLATFIYSGILYGIFLFYLKRSLNLKSPSSLASCTDGFNVLQKEKR